MKLSRTQKIFAGIACVALYSIPLATINGALDIFMKTDPDIPGESTGGATGEYKSWIEIDSFSIGGSNPSTIGTGGIQTGKVSLSSLSVTMPVGQSSPEFFSLLTSGTVLTEVKLFMRDPTAPTEFMRIYLNNVTVDSLSWSGTAGEPRPYQAMSLFYSKIKVEHVSSDGKTVNSAQWDLASNTK